MLKPKVAPKKESQNLEWELYSALKRTREGDGLSLETIAKCLKESFAWEELGAIIKCLEEDRE